VTAVNMEPLFPMTPTRTRGPKPSSRRGYHHGDLKNALRAAGSALLARHGAQGLSLREIAVAAGVSHTAAYRHFADKEALLADLAEEGFRRLAQINRETMATTQGGPLAQLAACGRAYVRFGLEQPQLLQLMFGPALPDGSAHPGLRAASEDLAQTLAGIVAAGQENGEIRAVPLGDVTLAAWSLVHGLALLIVGRRIPVPAIDDAFVEHASHACVALLFAGIAKAEEDPRGSRV
jgi:AcrR family transcriptional regulator